jgi:hypothetical protein
VGDYWSKHFLGCELVLAGIVTVGFSIWIEAGGGLDSVDQVLLNDRAVIYGTIASIDGALLGFVIATVAIILSFAQGDRFEILRQSSPYETLWRTLRSTIRALALASLAALVALLVDRDASPNSAAMTVCFGLSVLTLLRLGRTIWILERVIAVVTGAKGS